MKKRTIIFATIMVLCLFTVSLAGCGSSDKYFENDTKYAISHDSKIMNFPINVLLDTQKSSITFDKSGNVKMQFIINKLAIDLLNTKILPGRSTTQ